MQYEPDIQDQYGNSMPAPDPNETRRRERLFVRNAVKRVLQAECQNEGVMSWMPLRLKQLDHGILKGSLSDDECLTILAIWTHVHIEQNGDPPQSPFEINCAEKMEYSIDPTVPFCESETLSVWCDADDHCYEINYEMHSWHARLEHKHQLSFEKARQLIEQSPEAVDEETRGLVNCAESYMPALKEAQEQRAAIEKRCEDSVVDEDQSAMWRCLVKSLGGSISTEVVEHCRSVFQVEFCSRSTQEGRPSSSDLNVEVGELQGDGNEYGASSSERTQSTVVPTEGVETLDVSKGGSKSFAQLKIERGDWMVHNLDPKVMTNIELQNAVNKEGTIHGWPQFESEKGNGAYEAYKRAYFRIKKKPYERDDRGKKKQPKQPK